MRNSFLLIFINLLFFSWANSAVGEVINANYAAGNVYSQTDAGVKIYRNLRYAAKPAAFAADTSSDRLLDLYLPEKASGKLPVILFVHGGGFSGGDKNGTAVVCRPLAALGYAVVSINYRLELKRQKVSGASAGANMAAGVPATGKFHPALQNAVQIASDDAQLALQWIKDNANQYNLNTAAVAISGGSAGGMTALYTAYVADQKILTIKAVVNLWGGLPDAGVIKKNAPPVLTFHGDGDKTIHVDFAHAIKQQMDKVGNTQSVLHIMEGKGHAQYNFIAKEKTDEIDAFLQKVL